MISSVSRRAPMTRRSRKPTGAWPENTTPPTSARRRGGRGEVQEDQRGLQRPLGYAETRPVRQYGGARGVQQRVEGSYAGGGYSGGFSADFSGFGDIFETFFGGGGQAACRPAPPRCRPPDEDAHHARGGGARDGEGGRRRPRRTLSGVRRLGGERDEEDHHLPDLWRQRPDAADEPVHLRELRPDDALHRLRRPGGRVPRPGARPAAERGGTGVPGRR